MKKSRFQLFCANLKKPLFLLPFVALLHLLIWFPGKMSPDSWACYQTAMTKSYSLHHPPLFSVLWGWLDALYPGPALMFVVQWLFWWIAALLGIRLHRHSSLSWWFLLMWLWPPVFLYSSFIWKDIHFVYGYLLLGMWLAFHQNRGTAPSWKASLLFFTILFYSTAVKYQAQFILPWLTCWFVFLQCRRIIFALIGGAIISGLILGGIGWMHDFLVPEKNASHSWQYVKIYDLSGMSVHSKQVLVPDFLWKKPNLTWEEIEKKYDYLWEPLIVDEDSPLRGTHNKAERKQLRAAWKKAVLNNPWSYIHHRSRNWIKTLIGGVGKQELINLLKENNLPTIFSFAASPFAFLFSLPFVLYSFYLAIRARRKTEAATPLFVFSGMSLTLLGVLFVFSLAATPRYIILCFGTLVFSLPFAVSCRNALKENKVSDKRSA